MRTFFKATLLASVIAPLTFADSRLDATINVMNYPLARVFQSHRTLTGVLVDAQVVRVRSGPKGILPGLTLGFTNALIGTQIGTRTVTAHQYVVRIDALGGTPAECITVVQGGPTLLVPGIAVFLAAEFDERGEILFVRLIPAKTPEAYSIKGLEEKRLEGNR